MSVNEVYGPADDSNVNLIAIKGDNKGLIYLLFVGQKMYIFIDSFVDNVCDSSFRIQIKVRF